MKYKHFDEVIMETPKCLLLKSSKEKKLMKLWRTEKSRNPFNKKYKNSKDIEIECRNSTAVNKLPINKAWFYGKFNIGDRIGLIYEYIEGKTVKELMDLHEDKDPIEYEKYASYISSLHKEILKCKCPKNMMSWKEDFKTKICKSWSHSKEEKKEAMSLLQSLPDSDNLCHGSLHYGNVIVSNNTPYAIDFATTTSGPALFDIAKAVYSIQQKHNIKLHQQNHPNNWELKMKQKESLSKRYMDQMEVSWDDIKDYHYLISVCKLGRKEYLYKMPDGKFFRK